MQKILAKNVVIASMKLIYKTYAFSTKKIKLMHFLLNEVDKYFRIIYY